MLEFFSTGYSATAPGIRPRAVRAAGPVCLLSAVMLVCSAATAIAAEPVVVDADGDGLIEIHTLEDLNDMRYNLAGTSLKRSPDDPGNTTGCLAGVCRGYELMANLDFDGPDDDTSSWTKTKKGKIILDEDDHNSDWFDVEAGGWLPIGDCGPDGVCEDIADEASDNRPFTAVFEGNGHTISNLAISRSLRALGLFGQIETPGEIHNLGLIGNAADFTGARRGGYVGGLAGYTYGALITASYATGFVSGSGMGEESIGGLVGFMQGGVITDSNALGDVDGGAGDSDKVGGLVGLASGSVTSSYTASAVDGGDGHMDMTGGLVGALARGSITSCHATGSVTGGDGWADLTGGFVGHMAGRIVASHSTGNSNGGDGSSDSVGAFAGTMASGFIIDSYSTGDADGGKGDKERVGAFVGMQFAGSIIASHAEGSAFGGQSGDENRIGGLVGSQRGGYVLASYATGSATGGPGGDHMVGGLVGQQKNGSIAGSYATGNAEGGRRRGDMVGGLVGRQSKGSIVASYATGAAVGGEGSRDSAGGLVGRQTGGVIASSYATGIADGGDDGKDMVGGLVGAQTNGFITASYAIGIPDGGEGSADSVGALVGLVEEEGIVKASRGFAARQRGEKDGMDGSQDWAGEAKTAAEILVGDGVALAEDLSALKVLASDAWKAWNFRTQGQNPVLVYADYDGDKVCFHCAADVDNAPKDTRFIPFCTNPPTPIPGQRPGPAPGLESSEGSSGTPPSSLPGEPSSLYTPAESSTSLAAPAY